jgi:hypothetical protein
VDIDDSPPTIQVLIVEAVPRAVKDYSREGTLDPTWLAALADALEDAGCTDAETLGHLRGPGEQVRGCWVLVLLFGKP